MIEKCISPNLAKELLSVLYYLEDDFVDMLPSSFIENLTSLAADANKNFVLQKNKKLNEQDISEECKELLAVLYYQSSITDKQKELLANWANKDNFN